MRICPDLFAPSDSDYTLNTDAAASVRSLNAGLPTLFIPCDVTFGTFMTTEQLDRLRHSGDPLCEAVARMIDVWTPALRKMTGGLMPDDLVIEPARYDQRQNSRRGVQGGL